MFRTVTLNTGFDELFVVSSLQYGEVSSVVRHSTFASGKGINAARIMHSLGASVKAYAIIGLSEEQEFRRCLLKDGIDYFLIPIKAPTRRNLTLLNLDSSAPAAHSAGRGFVVRDVGLIFPLFEQLTHEVEEGDVVMLHGSIPEGLPASLWSEIALLASQKGASILVDTYGPPLLHILGSSNIEICKPNEAESKIISGLRIGDSTQSVLTALRYMVSQGVSLPIISRGADGLVFVAEGSIWEAVRPIPKPRLLVGAGDACMAGLAVAFGDGKLSVFEIVKWGVAVAAAHVQGGVVENEKIDYRAKELEPGVVFRRLGKL
ncbi:MAG: 1-phosphofructokinase family hexose kinase [Thermoanaerobaculia bacterium]